MKDSVTLLTVCVFASVLIGCSKGLSGTYKHEKSGKIVEFASSTDFKMHYPNGAVIDGTYKKTKAGYELSAAGGFIIAVAKKEGKNLRMGNVQYVMQKANSKILHYCTVIYLAVSLLCVILNTWYSSTVNGEPYSTIFLSFFWPIILVFLLFVLVVLIILAIITKGEMIDVT